MSLIKPGVGELLDRLTVLDLKVVACQNPDLVTRFKDEHSGILAIPKLMDANLDAYQASLVVEYQNLLADTNATLWRLENEIRRVSNPGNLAAKAKAIITLNDYRSRLIAAVNEFFGDPTEEKIYR